MAGTIRRAAKWGLALSLLAAGGAGTWYVTANGWPERAWRFIGRQSSEDSTQQVASSSQSVSDLDAVAGAWAETAPSRAESAPPSSPVARSAETSPPDRYAFVVETAPASPTLPVEAVADSYAQPPANATKDLGNTAAIESGPGTAVPQQARTSPAEGTAALARGQELDDEPRPLNVVATEPAEPRPLNPTGSEIAVAAAQNPLANPFGGSPAPAAADRYSVAPLPAQAAEAAAESEAVQAQSAQPKASDSVASESIAPLPALPEEVEPLPKSRQESGNVLRQDAGARREHGLTELGGASAPVANEGSARSQQYSLDARPLGALASEPGAVEVEGTGRPGERALEGPQRPALMIQKFAPPEIQVGKPAKFIVQVRNVGSQAADGLVVRDEVPQGTRLISTSPAAEREGSQLVWQLGKLSPGEDRSVEMQVMPTNEGEIGSVATVAYSAQASVKTRCTMPQLALRLTAPSKVLVGQQQRVKIELRNPGSGDATGVMLYENVPPNVRHPAGPALEFDIGTLRAGESRELELVLIAEKPGKTVNVLSARGDGNLQVQQQVEFEVIAPALEVDVNGPERRYLERPATYEVSVENPGTAPAHDIQIITKLPKGLQFVRANNMGEYDPASHAVYWSLAELPEGERGTVELVAMPVETGPQTLQVESRAAMGLADQVQRQIVIDGLAAIMFEVRDLEDPIEVGGETGYEIRIINQGTKAATNVQLGVKLPPGLRLLSAEGETQQAEQRGTILFEPIAQLGAKSDTVYRLRVQGTQAGDQRVTVEVTTDDLAQPIRREESTRVFGDE